MWYIHFRDFIDGQWSKWVDSSYGPYTHESAAKTFVERYNSKDKTREYRYAVATTRGQKPGQNTSIPNAKPPAPDAPEPKGMPPATTTWTPDRGPQMANSKGYSIFKYQLPIMESFSLDLPEGSTILRCETIEGKAWMWILHDLRKPKKPYKFRAFKTGSDIPDDVANKLVGCAGFYTLHVQQELCLYVFQEAA